MKKYIKCATSKIKLQDVIDYLVDEACPECQMSSSLIRQLARAIYHYIKVEEAEMGERYESIYDADIGGIIDASSSDIHYLGYYLMFGPEGVEEDWAAEHLYSNGTLRPSNYDFGL